MSNIDKRRLFVNMPCMNEKTEALCEAAAKVFTRYGVKRTTMNDIAQAAGVARQTLYNIFPNKEAVLLGTIRLFMDQARRQAEAELAASDELRDKLEIIFDHLVRRPYLMAHATPNAEDIINGVGADSRNAIAEAREGFRPVVRKVLEPAQERLQANGIGIDQLADSILNLSSAAKHEARDFAHLDELLKTMTAMVVRCAS